MTLQILVIDLFLKNPIHQMKKARLFTKKNSRNKYACMFFSWRDEC